MWWGQTSRLDLLSETPDKSSFNVLLISQGDSRHVLHTLAKKYIHPECKTLKIFVYEPRLENIARSLLFTTLTLDDQLGLGPKTSYFMDLYGNTLIRQATWQYLHEAAVRLTKVITNFNFAATILPSISLEYLKYKERDQLENIFKYWSKPDDWNILDFWNQRVRAALGTRYDARVGVFDWDLHMRYRPYGADFLSNTEYKRFREKGIAFLQDDTDPCIANATLSNFSADATRPAAGYFGDIETGPFPAFGFDCEDKDMLKKVNGMFRKTATDITERNVQRMFYEIQNKSEFKAPKDINSSDIIRQDCSEQLKARKPTWSRDVLGDKYFSIPITGVDIIYLPLSALNDFPRKQQFENFFDLVTVPQHLVAKLPVAWTVMCKNNSRIVVESLKFALSYRKDGLDKAKTELDEQMKDFGCETLGTYDCKVDELFAYKLSK